jgi:hypothetical protein
MTFPNELYSDEHAGTVINVFDEQEAAVAAIARLRDSGFADENIEFAMRGERQPRGISRVGERGAAIALGQLWAFVGVLLGTGVGLLGLIFLDSVGTWALPAGALLGLAVGGLLGQELARRGIVAERDPADADVVRKALRTGRAVVLVRAGGRAADVVRLLGPSALMVAAGKSGSSHSSPHGAL